MHLYTLHRITYREHGLPFVSIIPQGTPVRKEGRQYWCLPWKGMKRAERDYLQAYGFVLLACEVGSDLPGFSVDGGAPKENH